MPLGGDKEVSHSLRGSQDPDGRGAALTPANSPGAASSKSKRASRSPLAWSVKCENACTTCPVSTEGWTRRVHFVREGGGGGGRLDEPPRARRASPAHEQPERTRAEPRHCEDAPAAAAAQRVLSRRVRYGRWTFTREVMKAF